MPPHHVLRSLACELQSNLVGFVEVDWIVPQLCLHGILATLVSQQYLKVGCCNLLVPTRTALLALTSVEIILIIRVSALCKFSGHAAEYPSKIDMFRRTQPCTLNPSSYWPNVCVKFVPRFLVCLFICESVSFNFHHWLNFNIGAMVVELVNTSILDKDTSGELSCVQNPLLCSLVFPKPFYPMNLIQGVMACHLRPLIGCGVL